MAAGKTLSPREIVVTSWLIGRPVCVCNFELPDSWVRPVETLDKITVMARIDDRRADLATSCSNNWVFMEVVTRTAANCVSLILECLWLLALEEGAARILNRQSRSCQSVREVE